MMLLGPFTEADFKRFCALLREVERDRPDELFTIVMIDPDTSMEEALEILERSFPPRDRPN